MVAAFEETRFQIYLEFQASSAIQTRPMNSGKVSARQPSITYVLQIWLARTANMQHDAINQQTSHLTPSPTRS
jgi:hypothetical protein